VGRFPPRRHAYNIARAASYFSRSTTSSGTIARSTHRWGKRLFLGPPLTMASKRGFAAKKSS
jgi:hypothetical protein